MRNAVKLLEESGYLKKVQGSGTYVQKRAVDTERPVPHTDQPGNIALVMMNSDYVFLDVMRGLQTASCKEGICSIPSSRTAITSRNVWY